MSDLELRELLDNEYEDMIEFQCYHPLDFNKTPRVFDSSGNINELVPISLDLARQIFVRLFFGGFNPGRSSNKTPPSKRFDLLLQQFEGRANFFTNISLSDGVRKLPRPHEIICDSWSSYLSHYCLVLQTDENEGCDMRIIDTHLIHDLDSFLKLDSARLKNDFESTTSASFFLKQRDPRLNIQSDIQKFLTEQEFTESHAKAHLSGISKAAAQNLSADVFSKEIVYGRKCCAEEEVASLFERFCRYFMAPEFYTISDFSRYVIDSGVVLTDRDKFVLLLAYGDD